MVAQQRATSAFLHRWYIQTSTCTGQYDHTSMCDISTICSAVIDTGRSANFFKDTESELTGSHILEMVTSKAWGGMWLVRSGNVS